MNYILKKILFILIPVAILLFISYFLLLILPSSTKKNKEISKKIEEVFQEKIILNKKTDDSFSLLNKNMDVKYNIVLDPGHGGSDTGFITPLATTEKYLTLEFCFILARELRLLGFNVFLTRNSDYLLSREDRFDIVLENKADLFLSIHYAYSKNKKEKGSRIYNYGKIINELSELEDKYTDEDNKDYIRTVQTIQKEEQLLYKLKDKLNIFQTQNSLDLKILKHSLDNVPSLVFFVSYLSNKSDLKSLKNKKYIENYAKEIAKIIRQSFYN
jgi:N-acetylmuramoyl-L-alanine amidase